MQQAQTPQNAKIVIRTKSGEILLEYNIQYKNPKELKEQYEESRQVWAEYHVEAETEGFIMGNSHTYAEQCMMYISLN